MSRLIVVLLLLGSVSVAPAQHESWNADENDESFEKVLNDKIDRFLEKVSRGITKGDIEEIFIADTIDRKPRRTLRTADLETDAYAHSYSGDMVVDAGEEIKGNVIVKGGDLEVRGTVDGDVLVVGGTLFVIDDGLVTGNARVINGEIVKSGGGRIEGSEDGRTSSASYREKRFRFRSYGTDFDVPWAIDRTNIDNVMLRYNRVEGLFIGLGSEKKYYWDGRRSWTAFGGAGWGFRSHTWRYNLGLARQMALSDDGSHLLELGVEGYSLTDSKDNWIISTNENSAAAFFIHEDFLDFFSRRGITGHLAWYAQGSVVRTEVRVGYAADTYGSLDQRTDWALFGGNKMFRPNPPIQDGKMRTIIASTGLTTLDKTSSGPEGWAIHFSSEIGSGMKGSDFSFNTLIGDIRRYQPIGRHDNLNLRFRFATAEGFLPPQKSYELGGIGTLHAYRYKSVVGDGVLPGNRMLLMNAEYILDGNFLDEIDFWPANILSGLTFIFMSDAGLVRSVAPSDPATSGFTDIGFGDLAHDFGVGISNRSGSFRLAYTWRTDIKAPGVIIFRFVRPF